MATYSILLVNRSSVEASLESTAKHAVKLGLPALTWSWGTVYKREDYDCDGKPTVRYAIPLEVEGDSPRFEGWNFIAALEHTPEGNISKCAPEETVPEVYRTGAPVCDHCGIRRYRVRSYILRHDDGRVVQVGSSCIQDFFQGKNITAVLAKAQCAFELSGIVDDEGGGCGGGRTEYPLETYLAVTAWCIRADGWMSRGQASEKNIESTADQALRVYGGDGAKLKARCDGPLDCDREEAEKAIAWAKDTEADSDYMYNVQVIARLGYTSSANAGFAASMIVAHHKFLDRQREKLEAAATSCHLGTVGTKVTFGTIVKKLEQLSADPLTLVGVICFETQYGWSTLLKFRASTGATVSWKTGDCGITRIDVGKKYTLQGTIKAHGEYNGVKETSLTRCKINEVGDAS